MYVKENQRNAMIKMHSKYFTDSMNNIILKVGYCL